MDPVSLNDGTICLSLQFRTESQAGSRRTAPGQPPRLTSQQGKRVPPDQALREVTEHIYKKDWARVANKLGFFTQDVEEIKGAYPNNPQQQVLRRLCLLMNGYRFFLGIYK